MANRRMAAAVAAVLLSVCAAPAARAHDWTFISPEGRWDWREHPKDETAAAFARVFSNPAEVVKAEALVTSLGTFELYVNGKRIERFEGGNRCDFLSPGASDPTTRRYFVRYDVTDEWKRNDGDENSLSAFVSRAWYSDKIGRRGDVAPALAVKLRLTMQDGAEEVYSTDETWNASFKTPFERCGIFWGEIRDGRVSGDPSECAGGAQAVLNERFDGAVSEFRGPGVTLRRDLARKPEAAYVYRTAEGAGRDRFGKVVIERRYAPGEEMSLAPGERLVLDYGQNAAYIPEIVASSSPGSRIFFRGGEMLNESNGEKSRGNDGPAGSVYRENLRSIKEDGNAAGYVFAGTGRETYLPSFTFLGYRYAEVTATGKVTIHSIESIPVTSVAKSMERGEIETGDASVNKLVSNIRWSMLSNYLSMPTDCPQRDERKGWMADAQVFAPSAYRIADVHSFLGKYCADMRDTQDRRGLYPSVVPRLIGGGSSYGKFGWADAGVIVPYVSWRMTGDASIADEHWDSMCRFLGCLEKTGYRTAECSERGFQFADWLSFEKYETHLGGAKGGRQNKDYLPETLVYWDYLAGCHWLWDARMMREMALALGKGAEAERFEAMAKKAKRYVQGEFMKDGGRLPVYLRDMQTPHLFALKLGLYDDDAVRKEAIAQLVANIESRGGKLSTGFLGTPIIMDVLTYEAGRPDLAYTLLLQHGVPGWLYAVDQGATTVWERWNNFMPEDGFGDRKVSFNHYAYGAVLDWLYGTAAGIRPGKDGGFNRSFVLAPIPDRRLGSVNARFKTGKGYVESAWKYDGERCVWSFSVPKGSTATVVANGRSAEYAAGRYTIELK